MKTIGTSYPPTPITPEYTDGEVTFSMTFKELAALHAVLYYTNCIILHSNLTEEGVDLLRGVQRSVEGEINTAHPDWRHPLYPPDVYIDVIDYKGSAMKNRPTGETGTLSWDEVAIND